MAAFNLFDQFVTDKCAGVHANALNANTDTLKCYLSNDAPVKATDAVKTDVAEISTGNGYTGPIDIENAGGGQSGGTITITAADKVVNASGDVGPFQYVVLYNDTPSSPADPLIGWWDYGSPITLHDGESFTLDFGASLLVET